MRFHVVTIGALLLAAGAASLSGCGATTAPPASRPAPSSTISFSTTVTSISDSGTGSLRAAIQSVNAQAPGTYSAITFQVNGTITLASSLPPISEKVKLDATTAPTYAGTAPVVEVNANQNGGLIFATGSAGSQLLGLAVDNASGNGVTLNAGSITLNGNYIGLNLAGAASGNAGDGVYVSSTSSNNVIGLGNTFTVTVPAYTITDILIPPAQ